MQQPAPIFRVYRLKWYWHVTALFPLSLGIGFAAATWIDQASGHKDPNAVNWIVALGLIVIGVCLSVYLFTASVRFTENAIEQRTLFGLSALPIDAILGRSQFERDTGEGKFVYMRLVPSSEQFKPLDLTQYYCYDQDFYQWFNALPDLQFARPQAPKSPGD